MGDKVGPFRTEEKLASALVELERMTRELGSRPPAPAGGHDLSRLDWFDLRDMLLLVLVACTVALAAIDRKESRGAHQREDLPGMLPEWKLNQVVTMKDGEIRLAREAVRNRSPRKAA